jgi:hypothetical protein
MLSYSECLIIRAILCGRPSPLPFSSDRRHLASTLGRRRLGRRTVQPTEMRRRRDVRSASAQFDAWIRSSRPEARFRDLAEGVTRDYQRPRLWVTTCPLRVQRTHVQFLRDSDPTDRRGSLYAPAIAPCSPRFPAAQQRNSRSLLTGRRHHHSTRS